MTTNVLLLLGLVAFGNGLKIMTIGDWGDDNANQVAVAELMSSWCGRRGCDFILNTADNFYPDGVDSPTHPRFNTTWRWIYDLPNIDNLTWYQSVGNHDYGILDDRELNQVVYGDTEPRWHLPWLWYDHYATDGTTTVHLIIIDTMSFILRKHDSELQRQWLIDTLNTSRGDWKIVVGHSPPYSAGGHAPGTVTIRDQIVPILEEFGVDVFLNGDEHNLEHISKIVQRDIDYVISGGGGRGLYEFSPAGEAVLNSWGLKVDYFGHHYGVVVFEFPRRNTMTAEFVDVVNEQVHYSFTRQKIFD